MDCQDHKNQLSRYIEALQENEKRQLNVQMHLLEVQKVNRDLKKQVEDANDFAQSKVKAHAKSEKANKELKNQIGELELMLYGRKQGGSPQKATLLRAQTSTKKLNMRSASKDLGSMLGSLRR